LATSRRPRFELRSPVGAIVRLRKE